MTTGPIVRAAVELGDYRPVVDAEDAAWQPVTYTAHAHHVTTLDREAVRVVERRLERMTLTLENEEAEAVDSYAPAVLELPTTVEGLEALIDLLTHTAAYLAQEPPA